MKVLNYGLDLDTTSFSWSWTLSPTSSWTFHAAVCLAYALSVKGLQGWVQSKSDATGKPWVPPKWMDTVKYWHNVALCLVSLGMGIIMIHETYLDGRYASWHTMACQNTPNIGIYGRANWTYLLSKVWEWVDTYWLIFYSKDVIPLHFFHHMTTFTMAALTHNFPVGGYCWVNSFVHFVMYAHYARPVRWARPLITATQLTQFVLVISVHTYGYLSAPGDCFDFTDVGAEWWYCQSVVALYFLFFVKFFYDNYLSGVATQKQKQKQVNTKKAKAA